VPTADKPVENVELGRVTVYPVNILDAPRCDDSNVGLIVIRDVFGAPMSVVARLSKSDTWGLSTRGDEDFNAVLRRFGIKGEGGQSA